MEVPLTKPLCRFIKASILAVSIRAFFDVSLDDGRVATNFESFLSALINWCATSRRSLLYVVSNFLKPQSL